VQQLANPALQSHAAMPLQHECPAGGETSHEASGFMDQPALARSCEINCANQRANDGNVLFLQARLFQAQQMHLVFRRQCAQQMKCPYVAAGIQRIREFLTHK